MNSKIRTQPVDWSDIYAHAELPVWKVTPHSYTKDAAALCSGGSALDIGCGEGHDAIHLAQQGYETTAIDISPDAIATLNHRASTVGVSIQTIISDARDLQLDSTYDVIVSYGFLHFAGKDTYKDYIEHIQAHTNTGGVHAFYTFGDVGNFHDIGKHKYWFPNRDSLASLYADWHIHKLDERTIKTYVKGDKGEDLYNSLVKILAQKLT